MPRVNVYLPHETNAWLASLPTESASSGSHESLLDALDAERDETVES